MSPVPPRVAMVTPRCLPEIGGIEAHVAEVAPRLSDLGWQVDVFATDRSGRLPTRERAGHGVIRRFRAYPSGRDWYASPGLFAALLRSRDELIHVQGVHTLVPPLAMVAALVTRRPYVLTFHTGGSSSAFRERARGLQWRLLRPLLRRASCLVAVSRYEAERFRAVVGDRVPIEVIRNGGSLPRPDSPVAVEPGLVVSVGRLERYKGHHRAIEAVAHLAPRRPDIRLEILGSGPYEQELKDLASRLGVSDRVTIRLVPPPDRQQMARALAAAGCVVLLSDYEAHPVAVMEALTQGRPVVVARTSGLTELAEDGWAVGVDADAPAGTIAAAIEAQLTSPVVPALDDLPTWETSVAGLAEVYARAARTREVVTADRGMGAHHGPHS